MILGCMCGYYPQLGLVEINLEFENNKYLVHSWDRCYPNAQPKVISESLITIEQATPTRSFVC